MQYFYTLSNTQMSHNTKTKPSAEVFRNIMRYSAAMKLLNSTGLVSGSAVTHLA